MLYKEGEKRVGKRQGRLKLNQISHITNPSVHGVGTPSIVQTSKADTKRNCARFSGELKGKRGAHSEIYKARELGRWGFLEVETFVYGHGVAALVREA